MTSVIEVIETLLKTQETKKSNESDGIVGLRIRWWRQMWIAASLWLTVQAIIQAY